MFLDWFSSKRVAITGAGGFIGSAITERLRRTPCRLNLISRDWSISPAADSAIAKVTGVSADLRTVSGWRQIFDGAEVIFHLSAQTDLYAAEADSSENERSNVAPVQALIKAARHATIPPTVIFASTATIVGLNKTNPVNDEYPDDPITVYDINKKRCEELLANAARSGDIQFCSLRLANVYGSGAPSKNANRGFLTAMMGKASRGEDLTLYGAGDSVRDFVHIDDVVSAFLKATLHMARLNGGHYVIASGVGHSLYHALCLVRDEAQAILERSVRVLQIPPPPHLHRIETRNFVGDSHRFRTLTGWDCERDLRSGIRSFMTRCRSSDHA